MTRSRALVAALVCTFATACGIAYAAGEADGGSVTKSIPFQPEGPLWFGLGSNAQTLSAAKTVALTDPQFQILDPGGAGRNVTLPSVGPTGNKRAGMWYLVYNTADADEDLTVKDSAASTISVVNRGEFALYVVDTGGTWDVAFQSGAYADFGTTGFETDLIAESTSAAGVTIDGVLLKDEGIDMSGLAVATGDFDITLKDNLASALDITQGANSYLKFVTTDSSEGITVSQPFDMAASKTAADQMINADLSLNHATAEGRAIDAQAIQLTTARSSGILAGVASATTSLAGDSGGTYADFYAVAPTDGGGTNTHVGLKIGASHDAWLDLTAIATGEGDILLADNLASAYEIREASAVYMKLVTTNSSEEVASMQRLTTTDGVASGTARIVGGRAYSAVSAADNLLASAGGSAHVDHAQTYSIPANTIKSGSHIKIKSHVIVTDASGTDTLEVKLYIGATTLVTTVAFDPDAASDFVIADCDLWSREAPSADSALVGRCTFITEDGTTHAAGASVLATTDLATNGALVIKASSKWSATTAGTNARLEALDVEIL